jgi:hypothetical protein
MISPYAQGYIKPWPLTTNQNTLLDLVHMSLESRLNVTSRLLALADLGFQTIRKLNVQGFPQPNSKKKGFIFITFPSLLVVAFFFRLPDFLYSNRAFSSLSFVTF